MAPDSPSSPPQFLTARVVVDDGEPKMTTLCAGYERGDWRKDDFVAHLFEFLLEFAFKWSHLARLNQNTAVQMVQEAARRIYASDDYARRGEFGELVLHAALRCHFDSQAAVAKLFYKTGDNDTIKGFDCVHVVEREDHLELWLGEAKFYADAAAAVRDALNSVEELTSTERLKREFVLIRGLVDDEWPHAEEFKALTAGKSLDEVFAVLRIPVMLTFNSSAVGAHDVVSHEYEQTLREEVETIFANFKDSEKLPKDIFVHLILVPLKDKQAFQKALHSKLKALQV